MYAATAARVFSTLRKPSVRHAFALEAASDPNILLRVLEQFAKRGMLVDAIDVRRTDLNGDQQFSVDLQVSDLDDPTADLIAGSLRQIPFVDQVLWVRR